MHSIIFSCYFLFLLQSQAIFERTIPVPHAVSLLPGRQWSTRGVGQEPRASPVPELPCGRQQCQALLRMPWERVSLSAAVPTLASFLLSTKQKVEPVSHWYLQILNLHMQSGARLWVLCLSFFFLAFSLDTAIDTGRSRICSNSFNKKT